MTTQQYLLCSKVMGQHGEEAAVTDTKADATWHQHLQEKGRISTGSLVQALPPDKLTDMLPFPQFYSQASFFFF